MHQSVDPLIFCEVCENKNTPLAKFYRYEDSVGFFFKIEVKENNNLNFERTPFSFSFSDDSSSQQQGFAAFSIACEDCMIHLLKRRILINYRLNHPNYNYYSLSYV